MVTVVVMPVVLVVFLILLVMSISEARTLDQNKGIRGTYTVERAVDGARPYGRTVYGSFVSDDGKTRSDDLTINGGDDLDLGEAVPAQYIPNAMGGSGVSVLDPRAAEDTWWLIAITVAVLVYWLWRFVWTPRLKPARSGAHDSAV
jgi:hypothetical protein